MSSNICNHCGCDTEYRSGGRICPACGAYQPRVISEGELSSLREAFQKLRLYEFDEAERDFGEMIRKYPRNAEVYWGHLMAKHGIRYEWTDDGRKIPVPDGPLPSSLTEDDDYRMALSLADEAMGAIYRAQAEKIDGFSKQSVPCEASATAASETVALSDGDDGGKKCDAHHNVLS